MNLKPQIFVLAGLLMFATTAGTVTIEIQANQAGAKINPAM